MKWRKTGFAGSLLQRQLTLVFRPQEIACPAQPAKRLIVQQSGGQDTVVHRGIIVNRRLYPKPEAGGKPGDTTRIAAVTEFSGFFLSASQDFSFTILSWLYAKSTFPATGLSASCG